MNVLVSSAGRRGALVRMVRDSLARNDLDGRIVATDISPLTAAGALADQLVLVPRCTDPSFVAAMLEVCREHSIDLVIPTIDTELPAYAAARDEFAAAGVTVLVSSPAVIDIGFDKVSTWQWLDAEGLPTVRQTTVAAALAEPEAWAGPLVVKPKRGSASIGVALLDGPMEIARHLEGNPDAAGDLVVQSRATGDEHTVDVWVGRDGRCAAAVPRRRLEVRAGEVSKGVTVHHPQLEALATAIAERLPGAFAALNIQVFVDGDDLRVIEINPRFGGGYPLTWQAGTDFLTLAFAAAGAPVEAPALAWRDGLVMLRYDDAVFVPGNEVGL